MKKTDLEKEVTIKVKKWQIPYLLGAMRLGIWAEDWCAALIQTSIGTYDTHSGKWILRVGHTIDQIKKQTKVKDENKEYGTDSALKWASELINKECKLNTKKVKEWQKREYEEWKKEEAKRKEEGKKRTKQAPKGITVKVTDEMIKKAKNWAEKVQSYKK